MLKITHFMTSYNVLVNLVAGKHIGPEVALFVLVNSGSGAPHTQSRPINVWSPTRSILTNDILPQLSASTRVQKQGTQTANNRSTKEQLTAFNGDEIEKASESPTTRHFGACFQDRGPGIRGYVFTFLVSCRTFKPDSKPTNNFKRLRHFNYFVSIF